MWWRGAPLFQASSAQARVRDMGRKSSISKLQPEARKHLEKLMREDRLTLDELLAEMQQQFPSVKVSRSGVHRYKAGFGEMMGRMREIETAAGALVDELGEGVGDKAGALLAQAVTTLAANAALNAHGAEKELSIKEVGELARAARAAMQARTMSIKEREAVEDAARRRLLEEQKAKLDAMGSKGGVTEETKFAIRDFLGIK